MDSRSQTMMREVIDRTLDFVKRATAAPYQAALRRGLPQATAASYVLAGNFRQAVSTSAELLAGTAGRCTPATGVWRSAARRRAVCDSVRGVREAQRAGARLSCSRRAGC